MSFSFFILGFFIAPNVLWWWWAQKRLPGTRSRILLALFMLPQVAWIAGILVVPDLFRRAHHFAPMWWMVLAYLWHLLVLPLSGFLLLASWPVRRRMDPSRRTFLKATAALTPPLAAGIGTVLVLPDLPAFRTRRVEIAMPFAPDGLTIAHVADLHYGKYTTRDSIERLVAEVNGLKADLVLMPGDLIDLSLADLDAALDLVKAFESPVYLCEGNHDRIDNGDEFIRRVKASGVPLLVDESVLIEVRDTRIRLHGTRWRRRQSDTELPAPRTEPGVFPILLAHHPHVFDHASGFPLTLSGHTHGGQLMWNERLGAGPMIFRYWSGEYSAKDRRLFVSNGVGNWFPLRTHAPAEIVHLTLRGV